MSPTEPVLGTGENSTDKAPRAAVWADPGRRSGAICVYGHRLDVDTVCLLVYNTQDGIAEAMATWCLTRAEVIGACWWMGAHGSKKWRQRWRGWVKQHDALFWYGNWAEVPDPPSGVPSVRVSSDPRNQT